MNKFICWITGGHRYLDKNITLEHDGGYCIFKNKCLKCGKVREDRILEDTILKGYECMEHVLDDD